MSKTWYTETWGYNPWGTSVIYKNSPGWYLREIYSSLGVDGVLATYVNNFYNLSKQHHSALMDALGVDGILATYVNNFYNLSKQQQTANNSLISKGFDDILNALGYQGTIAGYIDNFYNLSKQHHSALMNALGVDGILATYVNNFYNLSKQQQTANSALLSKGFSDVLEKLGSLSVSVEVDLSGVESRLDSIVRLLTVAGVVENSKDILDAIFGDMSLDATEAASSAVGSAIQSAFPFCVPAVLKQILGLLQSEPTPPEFHFDFWGAPLDFGFSDWQGLADMTSWLSRIGFAVMLFANTRRFVYSGGVAGD